jgi:putative tryptophan/tyrosine transport system substrate-binding protein
MRRREVITLLGSASAWPFLAHGQPTARPVIGFLNSAGAVQWAPFVAAFKRGLKESGYSEGETIAIEYRWAEGQNDRLPGLAADLVSKAVAVIVVSGGTPPVLAVRGVTRTIPVAFMTGDDPVEVGFVANMDRPGANMTGVTIFRVALGPGPLEILRELVPNNAPIGVLVSPINPGSETHGRNIGEAARATGQPLLLGRASSASEIETAVRSLLDQGARAIIVSVSPFFISQRDHLVALAARHAIPAIYPVRGFVEAGGLLSYGADLVDAYHELGLQTARLIKGANPAELAVLQSTKLDIAVNRKTANALGLSIPPALLARANKVID